MVILLKTKSEYIAMYQKGELTLESLSETPSQLIARQKIDPHALANSDTLAYIELMNDPLELLKDRDLLHKFTQEIRKKVVGEWKTVKSLFVSCCSIFVKNINLLPHSFVTGESSGGKSWVTMKVYEMFPEKIKFHRTKLTPEVFTYWQRQNPSHTWEGKILYIEDPKNSFINSDTFKVMMTEGTKATVVIKQVAIDIEIKGTPLILLTTAHTRPNKEITNRFNIVPIDESSEQTHLVLDFEADEDEQEEYEFKFKKALEMLQQVKVKIPFAKDLVTCFPIKNIRVRRDFKRFLALIKSSAALHQHQRELTPEGYVIASEDDYEVARDILSHIQSNELMVALNHKLKKAYDICIQLTDDKERLRGQIDVDDISSEEKNERLGSAWGFKVREAYAKNPSLASEKHWYTLIDDLAQNGLLIAKIDESSNKSRPATLYRAIKSGSFVLPKFEQVVGNNGK